MRDRYFTKYAVAAVRGFLKRNGRCDELPSELMECELDVLTDGEYEQVLETAISRGVKIYNFKRSHSTLPRVQAVLGFLRGIAFDSLLDVGSGRGVFLFPFLEEFSDVSVTCMDVLDKRVETLTDIKNGGVDRLEVMKADVCQKPLASDSVDVVTLLEVLEHIPDVGSAICSAVSMARKYVVVTVPSKKDDNPEHIHLLTKDRLTELFGECGVTRLSFGGVPGHLFMIARIGDEE